MAGMSDADKANLATLVGLLLVTFVGVARGAPYWGPTLAAGIGALAFAAYQLKIGVQGTFWLATFIVLTALAFGAAIGVRAVVAAYVAGFWLGVFWTHLWFVREGIGKQP
jgi:hypothetical protein